MTLAEARAALRLRGFTYIDDAFLTSALNQAKDILEESFGWPWLETGSSGTAPMVLDDVQYITSVVVPASVTVLKGFTKQQMLDLDPQLMSGVAVYWYLKNNTLYTYPTDASSILSVEYVRFSPDLVTDGDTPLFPSRLNKLWQDLAIVECYKETFNFQTATALWNDLQARAIPRAIQAYAVRNRQNPMVMNQSDLLVSIDG